MAINQKLIDRFLTIPSDFTFDECRKLLSLFGYEEQDKGKTSGSRVLFFRSLDKRKIMLHKPHPGNTMKQYLLKMVLQALKENGDIL